jgi:hypothetical protein
VLLVDALRGGVVHDLDIGVAPPRLNPSVVSVVEAVVA